MKRNPGHLPADAVGQRVDGVLANGRTFSDWAADGRGGCDWRRRGNAFDIDRYAVRGG